jgi:hypothetical protein|tara:strand:+ start:40 stop:735 length:696 start_codon:yes stop_codon:yes gene_type:complete
MQTSLFENINTKKKYYVYILINNIYNEIFYVGKGSNNRLDQHSNNFDSMIKNQDNKAHFFKDIKDKRKYQNYPKTKYIFDLKSRGGEIITKKIYFELTEEEAFIIEKIIIFILKRRIDYLYNIKHNGRRQTLKQFGGKLFNKSIGGDTKGEKAKMECINTDTFYNDYLKVNYIIDNSEFLQSLRNKEFINRNEFINYENLNEYIINEINSIKTEVQNFKIERKITVTNTVY